LLTSSGWPQLNLKKTRPEFYFFWIAILTSTLLMLPACQSIPAATTIPGTAVPAELPPPQRTSKSESGLPAAGNGQNPVSATQVSRAQPASDGTEIPVADIVPPVVYTIEASFDFETRTMDIVQTIQYRLQSPTQSTLNLINEPQRRGEDFSLTRIMVEGQEVNHPISEAGVLVIPLPEGSQAGDWVTTQIDFTYRVPMRASRLGYTQYQANFGDWYLIVPPYETQSGWQINPPSTVGEYISYELGSFDIQLSLQNAPENLTIAASLLPEKVAGTYHYTAPRLRSFAWSASPYYQVSESEVKGTHLASYYYANHQQAGEAALQAVAEAIELYSQVVGPIELANLSIVESLFLDGMEYHGLFFLGTEYYQEYDLTPKNYLLPIAVHETAHQWFYAVVANDQANEPWVDEVLCVYLEKIYYENRYPELVPWWWQFRVLRFEPQGWVNSTVYEHTQFRSYVDAVYLRGALWLDEVRERLGDDSFTAALHGYFYDHQYQQANGEDLLQALESPGF
jgi:hypothetical protein